MKREWLSPELEKLNVNRTHGIETDPVPVPPANAKCQQPGWPTKIGPKPNTQHLDGSIAEWWECESVGQAGDCPFISFERHHGECTCGNSGPGQS